MRSTCLAGFVVMIACGGGSNTPPPDGAPPDVAPDADDGRVTGRWLDTYHYAGGTKDASTSLAPSTVRAMVWNGSSWDSYPGNGATDGTFSIANVPHGEFTLQIDVDSIVTSARYIDYGADFGGRPDVATAQNVATKLEMQWSNLDAVTASTELELTSPETSAWQQLLEVTASPPPTIGATAIDMSQIWFGQYLIDGGAGQHLIGVELQPATANGVGYLAATRSITTGAGFHMTDGVNTAFSGAMTAVAADHSIGLNWKRAAFDANVADINPGAQPLNFELGVAAMPTSSSVGVMRPYGHLIHVTLAPLPPTDVDLGTVAYGNPIGADDGEFVFASRSFDTVLGLPGSNNTALLSTIAVARTITDTTPIAPFVTPVRTLQIAGQAATGTVSGVGPTPLITWTAPATGTPTHYLVIIYEADIVAGSTSLQPIAPFLTTASQLRVTPGVLVSGRHYLVSVRAEYEPGVDSQSHPFRHSLPEGGADAHSGLFSP